MEVTGTYIHTCEDGSVVGLSEGRLEGAPLIDGTEDGVDDGTDDGSILGCSEG